MNLLRLVFSTNRLNQIGQLQMQQGTGWAWREPVNRQLCDILELANKDSISGTKYW